MGDDRCVVVEAFGRLLSDTSLEAFDALLPTRPWREAVPSSFWQRWPVMAETDPRGRHDLHTRLVEVIGVEAAATAMEYLPPVPWRVLRAHGLDDLLWG